MDRARSWQGSPPGALAVIYLRVSTEDQTRGMSLESQEAICRDYCSRQRITVDRIFVDRWLSAKTDEREAFQAMIAYCRQSRGAVSPTEATSNRELVVDLVAALKPLLLVAA